MSNILSIVYTIVLFIFVYIPLIGLALKFINARIDAWQSESRIANNDILMERIDRTQEIITDIVTQVNQTYVEGIKNSSEPFSKEAQKEAKNQAIELAETLITSTLRDAVRSMYGDYDTWLDTVIESTVNQLKGGA